MPDYLSIRTDWILKACGEVRLKKANVSPYAVITFVCNKNILIAYASNQSSNIHVQLSPGVRCIK